MKKNLNICVDLKTVMQSETHLTIGHCYRGMLSRTGEDKFLFEETVSERTIRHNPKLYKGKYVSLIHMQNGRYGVYMRTIDPSVTIDRKELAFKVYSELMEALEVIEN